MIRLLTFSAAALLLAACSTAYGDYGSPYDPYPPHGSPNPPEYPQPGYPSPGYPNTGYPPSYPQPAYPGANPQQPAPNCPVTASRDWKAWINAMPGPGAQPKLIVSGKVVTPTAGYRVQFDPIQIAESYPAQAFVTVRPIPPTGPAAQMVETHEVRWEWPLRQQVGSVVIRCGDQTLAQISPLQTAY